MSDTKLKLDLLMKDATRINPAHQSRACFAQPFRNDPVSLRQVDQRVELDRQAGGFHEPPPPALEVRRASERSDEKRIASQKTGDVGFSNGEAIVPGTGNHDVLNLLEKTPLTWRTGVPGTIAIFYSGDFLLCTQLHAAS